MNNIDCFPPGTIITSLYPRDNPLMLFINDDLTHHHGVLRRNESALVVKSKIFHAPSGNSYDTACVLRNGRLFWVNCDFAMVVDE